MLEELFGKAVELGRRLSELEREAFGELLEGAGKLWVPYEPRPADRELTVLGVDSGWNLRFYEGFYVYAMRAAAVDETEQVHHPSIELDIMAGDQSGLTPENRLKLIAENAEHYIADQASREADLVLVDGSLIARLESADPRRLKVGRAELAEYHSLVRSLRDKDNVVFVSKYSQDTSLLRGRLGDIYYISHGTSGPGYVLGPPQEKNYNNYGIRYGIRITTAYVRLAEHARPLKIEVPAPLDEERVRWIIDTLAPRSVKGYPYTLYLAHRTVAVHDQLMDALCEAAGLSALPEAREVLEL